MTIELVRQPTSNTCASACIAMLTGLPVETVVDEFHWGFTNHLLAIDDYLKSKGVIVKRTEDRQRIEFETVYMLIVPSLNATGQFHVVLCDTRECTMDVTDPARRCSRRYVGHDAERGETELLSWIIDWEVVHAPAIGIVKEGQF